jgi:hypothetical protein
MKNILLWLDDIRNPFTYSDWLLQYAPEYKYNPETHTVVWVKNYKEFTDWITKNGLPTEIGFDHDLSDIHCNKSTYKEKTGLTCAQFLINYCMDNQLELPKWFVQSANPSGRENINRLLNNFRKFQYGL